MAIRSLCHLPKDAVLRQKANKVSSIDRSIQKLIDDMIETMHKEDGVGLAAPQVGVGLKVIVLQLPGEEAMALINPEVVKCSGEKQVTEGCLSVPGYAGKLKRSTAVTVKGLNRSGKAVRIKAEGLLAQALQHEIDHLNGVLFIDHVEDKQDIYRVSPQGEVEGCDSDG